MNGVPETDRAVLAGYGCDESGGYLIVDELEDQGWRRQWLRLKSSRFTLQALSGRYCTGRHDLASGRSQPCPERIELGPPPYEQCIDCFRATGFNPAFYNAQSISPEQQRRNREPHVVYLAHFGAGTLKVGMTYERRGIGRLLEQGARAAALLARFPDAYAARELEERVARALGIPEAIRPARKRHLLGAPFSAAQARLELANWARQIASLEPKLEQSPELLELDQHYGAPGLFDQPLSDLSESEPLAISGEYLGMIGDVLIAAQAGRRYMLSVGDLVAQRVRLSNSEQPNRISGQLALF